MVFNIANQNMAVTKFARFPVVLQYIIGITVAIVTSSNIDTLLFTRGNPKFAFIDIYKEKQTQLVGWQYLFRRWLNRLQISPSYSITGNTLMTIQ